MVIRGWARHATVDWTSVVAPHAMRAPINNLRHLLWDETLADGNTQKRFEKWARGDRRDVRFEVDTLIASEMKSGFVPDYNGLDLYDVQREAESAVKDWPERAEAIYMGLTESLGVHYPVIDDSGGEFWPLFEKCMESMSDCIRRQKISTEDRQWRIEYLAGWSLVVFSDFMGYYEKALTALCTGVEDLGVWKEVLEAELRSDDTGDRSCYWAADKAQIGEALARVLERMRDLPTH